MARLLIAMVALVAGALCLGLLEAPVRPASYSMCQPEDAFTLDPQRMSYNQDMRVCYAIFEGLTRWDNLTFEARPGVAESWEISPDKRTYTFHLRGDARWSNGDPVTAGDFEYAWRRALTPDTGADYAQQFFLIDGGEAFFNWRSALLEGYAHLPLEQRTPEAAKALREVSGRRFHDGVGCIALDDRTFQVRLARPTPYFLDLCCFAPFCPVHPATLESCASVDAESGRIEQRHEWTKPGRLVTNGPYSVSSWRFKRDMRLERNPLYVGAYPARSESVSIRIISNPSTAVLAYETGGVDFVEEVLCDYLPEMIAESDRGERRDLHKVLNFATYFWSFNCGETLPDGGANPFHDARVRRAFAMATNKQDLVDKVRRVGEPIASTFIPPGTIREFDPERRIHGVGYDPAGARKLLADAGWRSGASGVPVNAAGEAFPVVEMLCSTGSYHDKIAQAMGAMWESILGVRTRIVLRDSKSVGDDLQKHNFMIGRGSWFGDYGDPTTFLNVHRTGDGNNDRGYSDAHFDDLYDRAADTTDEAARMRLLEECERYTMEESLPLLPIFHYVRYYMYDADRLKGVSDHPRIVQYLWQIEKQRAPSDGSGG